MSERPAHFRLRRKMHRATGRFLAAVAVLLSAPTQRLVAQSQEHSDSQPRSQLQGREPSDATPQDATATVIVEEAVPELAHRYSVGGRFEVVGHSFNAVSYVVQIAESMEEMAMDDFGEDLRPPRPVLLVLNRPTREPKAPPFSVSLQADGETLVFIRWSENTAFADICQAIASGLLRRLNRTIGAEVPVPHWFELAYGLKLEADVRPGVLAAFREDSLAADVPSMAAILQMQGPFTQDRTAAARPAFWLLRVLEQQIANAQQERVFRRAFLRGHPWQAVLERHFPGRLDKPRLREIEWRTAFQNAVRGRQPPFASLRESAQRVRSMARIVAEINGRDTALGPAELWPLRREPTVRTAVQFQLRSLKLEILRANPAYRNAFHSLGRIFEAVMAEELGAFRKSLALYRRDVDKSDQTAREVNGLLDW